MKIPSMLLRQLYTYSSLENTPDGIAFRIKNRLTDVTLQKLVRLSVDGEALPLEKVAVEFGDGRRLAATDISAASPAAFPLRQTMRLSCPRTPLAKGKHEIAIAFEVPSYGELAFKVEDAVADEPPKQAAKTIPYSKESNYTPEIIKARQGFVEQFSGVKLQHIDKYSFDPEKTQGNIENFVGVAQIPIGLAGPLRVNGEHAKGEFLIPLATTEGTLVASYNRGMKVLNLSGGVSTCVVGDAMQRAPVFVFDSAREARDFTLWVDEHFTEIKAAAEETSRVAKLMEIDSYLASRFAYLRFNYTTGDAAGQNMVGRATFAACSWILDRIDNCRKFYLESNLATDKKASNVNIMRTRGKRVTAEVTIPRDVLIQHMRVEPESLAYHAQVANVGSFLSGANNNGAHSPNGITAMFIATGQDVANVSESSAGIVHAELTAARDLYLSITIPSLIVATHGGGTGLATQRESLAILGCTERGSVHKFAEIVAGVVLAGEISLASAISSSDWVSSHERYGRNR